MEVVDPDSLYDSFMTTRSSNTTAMVSLLPTDPSDMQDQYVDVEMLFSLEDFPEVEPQSAFFKISLNYTEVP